MFGQATRIAEAETAKTVHEELVRLTGQDFGLEAHRWRQWLRQEEQKVQGSPLLAKEFTDNSENSDRVGKQA